MNLYVSQTKLRKKSKNRSRNMHEEEVKEKISKRKKQPEVKIKKVRERIIQLGRENYTSPESTRKRANCPTTRSRLKHKHVKQLLTGY